MSFFSLYFQMINYFQAIQTAILYKKDIFEMFNYNLTIFLDLWKSFYIKWSTDKIWYFIVVSDFS